MNRWRCKGFALVLVLGIMVLLSILAAGIAFTVRSELNVAAVFAEQTQARYLAHAGLQRVLAELAADNPGVDSYAEGWAELRSDDEGWALTNGVFIVRVTDESGKLNINTADRDMLVAFFTQLTGDSLQAEEIADAIIDWRDSDDEPQLMGAEGDYYLTLEQPYRAKNAPFDSPYELLLVRGITREIFYGDPDLGIPPLPELVTTYSATPNVDERGLPRVNINTATREQLMEALGDILTEREIDAILRYRDGTQQQQRPPTQQPTEQQPPAGQPRPTQPGVPPSGLPRPQQPQPGTFQPGIQRPQQPPSGTQRPQQSPASGFQRPQQQPPSGIQRPQQSQTGTFQPGTQRPQQLPASGFQRPAQGLPSRGVPVEAVGQPQQGSGLPSTGQRPTGSQTSAGQQQQRRQIRSPLDLRQVLPTEKLVAIWERITTTDQAVFYGLVNLNTAPPEVLAALLPDNPAAVDEILAYREQNGGFQSVGELLFIGSLTQRELRQLVSRVCVKSSTFRLRAAGIVGNRRAVHLIDAVVERQLVASPTDTALTGTTDAGTTFSLQFIVRAWKER